MSDSGNNSGDIWGWLVLAIFVFAGYGVYAAFQTYIHPAASASATPAPVRDYSASRFRGTQEFGPLPANPRMVSMSVLTSWIPGDQKTGVLRYIISITVSKPTTMYTDSVFLRRLGSCTYS